MGRTSEGRTRHRRIPGSTPRHPAPGIPLRGRPSLSPLFPDQPSPHALSRIPRPRLMYFHRRGRSRMQGRYWHASQTSRNALDHSRRQRHHCSSLLKTQWPLSGLLGAQIRTQGRMTLHFLVVHPSAADPLFPTAFAVIMETAVRLRREHSCLE